MTGEIIKSFLVGLGFGVDDASLSKFNKSIKDASVRVTALYASIKVASAGIFWSISKISDGFEQMGYEYRIIQPAINKALVLRNELLKAYRTAGIDITKVIIQSIKFNMALAKTKFALQAIYTSVGAKFFPMLTNQMDIFRKKIYANMPKIQASLEKFVTFIFKAFEATTILGNRIWDILSRVYDFFYKLHQATDGWSTIILGVVAAWKFLNLAFLATPLGMIIAGIVALLALWDDFKTFKEGGQSLINWGSEMTQIIVGLSAAVVALTVAWGLFKTAFMIGKAIFSIGEAISWLRGIMKLFNIELGITDVLLMIAEAPFWAIIAAVTALVAGLVYLDAKFKIFGGALSGFFGGIGGKIMDWVGGSNHGALANTPGQGGGGNSPVLGNTSNNSATNVNVQQQTAINVNGSADAGATGKAIAGEQSRVNFDMTRNMVGAAR